VLLEQKQKMTVSLVNICHYKKPCYYKSLRHNGGGHKWKKSLIVCTSDGTCNQKETLTTQAAHRKYGIRKNE